MPRLEYSHEVLNTQLWEMEKTFRVVENTAETIFKILDEYEKQVEDKNHA